MGEATSKETKKQGSDILKKTDVYSKAFKEYVALAGKKDILMKDMNLKASLALETIAKIRNEQKIKYDKLRDESEIIISGKRQKVSLAVKINDAFLNAKGYRMVLAGSDVRNVSTYGQWKGYHSTLKRIIDELKPLMADKVFEQIVQNIEGINKVISKVKENIDDEDKTKPLDGIQVSVKNYLASFQSYASLMKTQQASKIAMESSAATIGKICLQSKGVQLVQMQAQISESTAVITVVSLCAVFFGVLIAFLLIL